MSTLGQIVAARVPVAEELPLVHTTRREVLPHIVAGHERYFLGQATTTAPAC